jgi:ribonuclease HIII
MSDLAKSLVCRGAVVTEAETATHYITSLTREQIAELRRHLESRGYAFKQPKYSHFAAAGTNINLTAYTNGKLLVQGKGTADFVRYYLEPQLLREIKFGYEHLLDENLSIEERIGVDESGKGDYFGPLVIAGVHADASGVKILHELKVRESKQLSDQRALKLAPIIAAKLKTKVVIVGPEKYNMLYDGMGNLNRILAWGHARVIENILSEVPCRKAVLDQFGDESLVRNALMKKGRTIELEQMHRAESDIVVAAASVVARGKFLARLQRLSKTFGIDLPKGASNKVIEVGRRFVEERGIQQLTKVAKLHFKTTQSILGVESNDGKSD